MAVSIRVLGLFLAAMLGLAPCARADEAGEARKAVEGFAAAFEAGDEKGVREGVASAPANGAAVPAYVELITSAMRLRTAAVGKFGDAAGGYFFGVAAGQGESRSKAIREAAVKIVGHSAIMSVAADEKAGRPGGTIILIQANNKWKLDGFTLFNLGAAKEVTEGRVAVAIKLAAISDGMAREINEGKQRDVAGAVMEFWSRAKSGALEVEDAMAAAKPAAASRQAGADAGGAAEMSARARRLSDKEITVAIDKAAEVLLAGLEGEIAAVKRIPPGAPLRRYRGMSSQRNGEIALAIYAILTAGRVTGDPRFRVSSKEMSGAIDYLLTIRENYTYAVALQALALSMLPDRPEFRKPLAAARDELLAGANKGIYSYNTSVQHENGDNSNTQYGQLGVWACQDQGLEIPITYWAAVDQYWRKMQGASGGWGYRATLPSDRWADTVMDPRDLVTPSMTAAGVASLFLAQEDIDRSVDLNPKPDEALDRGIRWLAENFDQYRDKFASDLYLAFSIERVALAGGIKKLGARDWYREGAAALLGVQQNDGAWNDRNWNTSFSSAVGTSYALLFLARGIAPIACAKLQYDGPWNARPRDCARFVHWLDKKTERTLNWQNLAIDSDPDDWRTPVLLITGHGDPNFSAEQIATLRRYVLKGGLIFSSADEGDVAFTQAIRYHYAPAIFNKLYEMRVLPDSHPVYQIDFKIKPPNQVHLLGLSNGVREVWIHSEDDVAASWQAYAVAKTQMFEVPANIYLYATGLSATPLKLEPLELPAPPVATTTLNIARLSYAGNFDPEPGAWGHFAADCRYRHAAVINEISTAIGDLDAAKTPIAHLTGTTAFTLSDHERARLLEFFDRGGVLLVDSAGGGDPFAGSFKAACASLFPDSPLAPVPDDSPILTGVIPGTTVMQDPERRRFATAQENHDRSLSLLQVRRNNRSIIVFSPGDLTAGLAGVRTWGIFGYTPEAAAHLTWNSLVFLATQSAPLAASTQAAVRVHAGPPMDPLAGLPDMLRIPNLADTYSTVSTPLGLIHLPR